MLTQRFKGSRAPQITEMGKDGTKCLGRAFVTWGEGMSIFLFGEKCQVGSMDEPTG